MATAPRRHRKFLRRIQCRTGHAGRVLPRHDQSRVSRSTCCPRASGRARCAGSTGSDPRDRTVHHRRRTRRHLGQWPDRGGARVVPEHSFRHAQSICWPRASAITAYSAAASSANSFIRRSANFINALRVAKPSSRFCAPHSPSPPREPLGPLAYPVSWLQRPDSSRIATIPDRREPTWSRNGLGGARSPPRPGARKQIHCEWSISRFAWEGGHFARKH